MTSESLLSPSEAPSLPSTLKINMTALNQNPLITPPDPPEHEFSANVSGENKDDDPVLVVDQSEVLPPTPTLSRSSSQSSSFPVQGLFDSEPVSIAPSTADPSAYSDSDCPDVINLMSRDYDLILRAAAKGPIKFRASELYSLDDRMLPRQRRLVRGDELARRVERFLKYRIDWFEPGLGVNTVCDATSCSPGPWHGIKRLAFAGLLTQYPFDDMDSVLMDIRNHLFNGKPSILEWIPEESSLPRASRAPSMSSKPVSKPKAVKPVKPVKNNQQPPKRPAAVAPSQKKLADLAEAAALLADEPLSRTRGVKRRYTEEDQEPRSDSTRTVTDKTVTDVTSEEPDTTKTAKKHKVVSDSKPKTQRSADSKSKNTRNRNSDKPRGPSESLCRNVKDTLNRRSEDKNNYEAFNDAILPENGPEIDLPRCDFTAEELKDIRELQDIGDRTGLHPEEVKLCKLLAMSSDLYKCQKARCFIGLALFVEYNLEKLGEDNPKFKVLNVGKAQFQLFGNVDVNKLSKMYTTFKKWGWVEDMTQQNIPQSYIDRFPQAHRLALRNEVAEYEANLPVAKRIFKV
ncbi:hypothetical protein Z517_06307 [Fonsecaea pedrosoi CBS 271.37]|uniref:Uncharacterized protein n=1 Tax=Fonsecaea pedrosoi CBS 271.37 TaxID=1442368 RepID=A0A0D2GFV3_9EURO|nr:uncharacterized protein Z517_06307 [Fonsecaea pedrosoi CBS 271.37]KIW79693.1 hypothetical protein Z517_06307 [Fonsecaea pedrosoi CBS 271.37]